MNFWCPPPNWLPKNWRKNGLSGSRRGFLAGDADLDFDDAGDDFFDNRGEAGGDFDIIGQRPIIDDKANGFGLRAWSLA
jgi:hypothetical protein